MNKVAAGIGALLVAASLLAGCQANAEVKAGPSPVAGNKLFIPQGYKDYLAKLKLTEVAAMPYFSKPFITVAEDEAGRQHAVVFHTAEDAYSVKLPVAYEQIFKLSGDPEASNLHLFEINKKLYWSHTNGDGTRYWDLNGKATDPFSQAEKAAAPDFYAMFQNASEMRIRYGDGNRLTVTDPSEIEELTAAMEEMVWEPASGPDAVGQNFFLEIGSGDEKVRLSAVGDIIYHGKYYHCERRDAFKTLNSAVVGYGLEKIPGLLGLDQKTTSP